VVYALICAVESWVLESGLASWYCDRSTPGVGAGQRDEYFRTNQPFAITLHPLGRIAPANDRLCVGASDVPGPGAFFIRQRPVRTNFDRRRLALVEDRAGGASRRLENFAAGRGAFHRLAHGAAHGDVGRPVRNHDIEIAFGNRLSLRQPGQANSGFVWRL
jgi:hypothetical protein